MCRMLAAVNGIPGERLIVPFARMAQGWNALHELNPTLGKFDHPDGWGAVYVAAGRWKRVRSPVPFWADPTVAALRDKMVFLIHARRASVGAVTAANVHPFVATRSDETFYFCHNGTIHDPAIAAYHGDTDSARYFHYLLDRFDAHDPEGSLARAVSALTDYSAVNAFLLTPGQLCVINRYNRYPRYYTMYRSGSVFSSEPLTEIESNWTPLDTDTVVCIER